MYSFTIADGDVTERDIRMYRKLPPETNYKEILVESVLGFGVICAVLAVLMLGEMALNQPTGVFDYHTGITTWN